MRGNIYEARARERKIAAIVSVIDEAAIDAGIHPWRHACAIARVWEAATESQWSDAAARAHVGPASEVTRRSVIAVYDRRSSGRPVCGACGRTYETYCAACSEVGQ